jgi:hypothetical protein
MDKTLTLPFMLSILGRNLQPFDGFIKQDFQEEVLKRIRKKGYAPSSDVSTKVGG